MELKFRREKLSRKAIDDLARRNMDASASNAFPFTTATGERILVCPSTIILRRRWT